MKHKGKSGKIVWLLRVHIFEIQSFEQSKYQILLYYSGSIIITESHP